MWDFKVTFCFVLIFDDMILGKRNLAGLKILLEKLDVSFSHIYRVSILYERFK
jgi:hypothetical protein